jgi:hypothetical protein
MKNNTNKIDPIFDSMTSLRHFFGWQIKNHLDAEIAEIIIPLLIGCPIL